jgi:hypothetical protein
MEEDDLVAASDFRKGEGVNGESPAKGSDLRETGG